MLADVLVDDRVELLLGDAPVPGSRVPPEGFAYGLCGVVSRHGKRGAMSRQLVLDPGAQIAPALPHLGQVLAVERAHHADASGEGSECTGTLSASNIDIVGDEDAP